MPGTDAALAYGIMHVLIRDGLVDRDYVDRYTVGFDALAERAQPNGRPSARRRRAASPVAQVESLARDYGTIKPAAIRLNYGMQRVAGGGNAVRAVACLPALVGAWRDSRGRRAAVVVGHLPGRQRGARAAGPHPRARRARSTCRRSAMRCSARAAGRARSSSTTAIRSPWRPSRRKVRAGSRARTCSSSCTTCSRPTPPTTPTSCCRPRRSSSSSTCTTRTVTCTCR